MQQRGLNPQLAAIWDNNLRTWEKKRNPIFAPWFAFGNLPDADFASAARDLAAKLYANDAKGKPVNTLIARTFAEAPSSMAQVAARYASVFNDVEQRWQEALASYEAKKRADTNLPPVSRRAGRRPRAGGQVQQPDIRQQFAGCW